jgi:hypothetical protein
LASIAARVANARDRRRPRGEFGGQPGDALHALALRAQLGVEGDAQMIELGHALVERLGEIEAEFLGRRFSLSRSGRSAWSVVQK